MNSLKFEIGDVLKFTPKRIKEAKEYNRHRHEQDYTIPGSKWHNFVIKNINKPLGVKFTHTITGNIEPIPVLILESEDIKGYWNMDCFEYYNNFDDDLFKL